MVIMETKIINLFGGPGCGKSTTASGIFYELKKRGYECELSPEFAKDKVWEDSLRTLDDQIYIFGKQYHRIWRLIGKVEYIICDSPLLNSVIYDSTDNQYLKGLVVSEFKKMNNINVFIERGNVFVQNGRNQDEEESKHIDSKIIDLLDEIGEKYVSFAQSDVVDEVVSAVETLKMVGK